MLELGKGFLFEARQKRLTFDDDAFIVSVHAPYAADTATGAQWFSVQDITEENRAAQAQAGLAARIVALSGRYAQLPTHAPEKTTLHLIHGKSDPVIHYGHCVSAAERLVGLGGDVTADVIPFLGHEINEKVMALVVERLTGHIPQHRWEEVQKAAAQQADR